MSGHGIHGAYVEAWVWVDLDKGHREYSDEEIIQCAKERHEKLGELEIGDEAIVSRGE